MNPVSIVDLNVIEFEDPVSMSSSVFKLALVAESIRVEQHSVAMPSSILAISFIFQLYLLVTDCKLVVVLKFFEHHINCFQVLP